MKAAWLIAECMTVTWFVAIATLSQVSGFSTIESGISSTDGITSGIVGAEKKLPPVIKPTDDIYWPEPDGIFSAVFSDGQILIPASPENINFTGGLDDQSWLIRNDLCPSFGCTDFYRQGNIIFPVLH